MPNSLRIAITGGMGSGKSTLCRQIEALGTPVFYCDDVARQLIATDPELRAAIASLLSSSPSVSSLPELPAGFKASSPSVSPLPEPPAGFKASSSSVSSLSEPPAGFKASLRAYLAQGPANAARVNRLVWPRVADAWQRFSAETAARGAERVVMECALLFESGFDALVDCAILVTAPPDLRLQRVTQRDGITPERAQQIMALQLTDDERRRRAHHVLTNDGTPADLLKAYTQLPL